MAFDWDQIEREAEPQRRLYRLLGEMLARRATADDLERARELLTTKPPSGDSWYSLGEGLFHTSRGSSAGFVLWASWAMEALGSDYDEAQLLAAWQRFALDSSDGLDEPLSDAWSSAPVAELGPDDYEEIDHTSDELTRTEVLEHERVAPPITSVLAASPHELICAIPSGPFAIRLFGIVYDDVDEFTLLALLRRGLLLACDVLISGRWVPVEHHPAFDVVLRKMREEAARVLADQHCVEPEKTHPGG